MSAVKQQDRDALLLSMPHSKVLGVSFRCTLDQFQWKTAKAITQFVMCSTADPVKAETPTTILFGFVFPQRSRHFSSSLSSLGPQTLPHSYITISIRQVTALKSTNNDSKERWRIVACCNFIRARKHYSLERSHEFPSVTVQIIHISARIYYSLYIMFLLLTQTCCNSPFYIITLLTELSLGGFVKPCGFSPSVLDLLGLFVLLRLGPMKQKQTEADGFPDFLTPLEYWDESTST